MISSSTAWRALTTITFAFIVVAVACSSEAATPTPPAPDPTSTATPVATSTATATTAPTATPSPVPTKTVVPTATATASPTTTPPTPTVTAVPKLSPTPLPTPDPRYGLIVSSDDSRAYELFGFNDYIDYTASLADVPPGARKILYISSVNPVPLQQIQASAAGAPGSVWYVLGEPNGHGRSVEDVLVGLHDTYEAIKQADPTALITSPSMLNFSFNCIGCSGYHTGGTWISSFRTQYMELYGVEPPIDIWAIDVFPLVWPGAGLTQSEAFPTVRDDLVIRQISDFRSWLDIWDDTRGKPIWVTEFGLHWGFPGWEFGVEGCNDGPSPIGEYLADDVKAYLGRVYTWFEENATEMNIERWFTFSTYKNIQVCQSDSGNGLSLLDSSGSSGELTEVGRFFYDWTRGIR